MFGACFDENWKVVHGYTETVEGLARFRGSKYVQSYIGESFLQAKKFLDEGREVLFSGTPCQIAGLKNFLRKFYQHLLTVDVVCHGVPSPKVWQKYLEESVCKAYFIKKRGTSVSVDDKIENINFRSKKQGWKHFCMDIVYRNGKEEVMPFSEDSYMNVFLSNLSLRPSCYACSTRIPYVQSDITLADFWGVDSLKPEIDDDKGCGLILINNERAFSLLRNLDCQLFQQKLDEVSKFNPSILYSVRVPVNRKFFYDVLEKWSLDSVYKISTSTNIVMRVIRNIYRKL